MVTIIGNGMGPYNFDNVNIDLKSFDKIICDQNFEEDGSNVLKLKFSQEIGRASCRERVYAPV